MKLAEHLPSPNTRLPVPEPVTENNETMTSIQSFQSQTAPAQTFTNVAAHDRSGDEDQVVRAVAVVALGGVALIHLLELQGKLAEVAYLGVGYVALIIGCVVAAAMLVHRNSRTGWMLAGGVALATFVGYGLTRTVGLPLSTDDIGNWLEPMGLASLFVEGTVVLLAAYALAPKTSTLSGRSDTRTSA